jgi:hypothetical protein
MNIMCDRYSDCGSIYLDRAIPGGPSTESMAQARGWIIWRGQTMGGQNQEVILCDKCVDMSRRMHRRHGYEALPGQYPIPELKILKPGE